IQGNLENVSDLPPSGVTADDIEDVLEQLVFEASDDVTKTENQRFERAIAQVDRFVEDRLLLLHRRREVLEGRISGAEEELARSIGAEQRTRNETQLRRLHEEREDLEKRMALLERRDDDAYQRFRQQAHDRRYATPRVERLLEAELRVE